MLEARFRSMPKWNRKTPLENRSSQFRVSYAKALDSLEYELRRLEARDVIIEAGYLPSQIRNDGWPLSKANPVHPGVVLYFTTKAGNLCFPCGTYSHLTCNLRAIALTLEALRAVDRYGATAEHQQYRGFAELPAPESMTVEAAAQFIGGHAATDPRLIVMNVDSFRDAYRTAASKLHPDRTGQADDFVKLQNAKAVLDQHHGITKGAAV